MITKQEIMNTTELKKSALSNSAKIVNGMNFLNEYFDNQNISLKDLEELSSGISDVSQIDNSLYSDIERYLETLQSKSFIEIRRFARQIAGTTKLQTSLEITKQLFFNAVKTVFRNNLDLLPEGETESPELSEIESPELSENENV